MTPGGDNVGQGARGEGEGYAEVCAERTERTGVGVDLGRGGGGAATRVMVYSGGRYWYGGHAGMRACVVL
jgi:hypothetical protein